MGNNICAKAFCAMIHDVETAMEFDAAETSILTERRVFIVFAASMNLSKAAAALDTYPSTISRAIQALEKQIGVALVARQGKNLTLTKMGERYVASIKPRLEEIYHIESTLRRIAHTDKISISILSQPGTYQGWLLKMVPALIEKWPQVSFRLLEINKAPHSLMEECDIFIGFGRNEIMRSDVVARSLGQVPIRVYAPSAMAIDTKRSYSLTDIHQMRIVAPVLYSEALSFALPIRRQFSFDNNVVACDNPYYAIELAVAMQAIAFSTPLVADPYVQTGKIIELRTQEALSPMSIDILHLNNSIHASLNSEICAFIAANAEGYIEPERK